MSRVDLRIRSLVVHGGGSFAGEAFGAALGREIEARLGPAAGRGDLSARFTAEARDASAAPAETPHRGDRFEATAAARVARRLVPRGAPPS